MATKVNGVEITEEAIQYELARLVDFYTQHMPEAKVMEQLEDLKARAKEQAIGAKLLMDEASRLDLTVPESDVDEKIAMMIENAGGEEGFQEILENQNLSIELVKMSIRQGRRVDMLVEKTTSDVTDPSEEEMRAHFEDHLDEYDLPDHAQVLHILIRPESESKEDKATARSRLLEIKAKLEDGDCDFGEMAEAHSDCPSGKQSGGSLGWIARGTMVPAFDAAVFALEDGAISDVVETELGMHLIHKIEHKAGGPADYADVSDKIRDFLRHAKRGEVLSAHVEALKSKAAIEED